MGRRRNNESISWRELILFVMVISGFYFLLALFDISITGEGGREWGKYLRETWGGGVLVILLFWLYVCVAGFLKVRIPKFPRQVLGTLQLYISLAFLLGILKNSGWDSELTIFAPGSIGLGIARFFVLNAGSFIALIFVAMSFLFTAYLFGSRILNLTLPSFESIQDSKIFKILGPIISRFNLNRYNSDKEAYYERPEKYENSSRVTRLNRKSSRNSKPKKIFSPESIPEPKLKPERGSDPFLSILSTEAEFNRSLSNSRNQNYKSDEYNEYYDDYENLEDMNGNYDENRNLNYEDIYENKSDNALARIEDLISSFDAGYYSPPKKKKSKERTKRIRRPFPEVLNISDEKQNSELIEENNNQEFEDGVFPPPLEIFGTDDFKEIKNDENKNKIILKNSEKQGKSVVQALRNFEVSASVANIIIGPQAIQFQLELSPGTKLSKISNLSDDLAMALAVTSVRIEAPIFGTHYVGVEIPNPERFNISLRSILENDNFKNSKSRLPLPLGLKINSEVFVKGLEELPHLLIAGGSGSGKSVFLNSCILGMCSKRTPDELRIILTDTKHVEFSIYQSLPHLLSRPLTESEGIIKALSWALKEAERRTELFTDSKTRNIAAYNRKASSSNEEKLPDIVIIIDELSDLMYSSGREAENLIVRIAQKSRALGIYLIISADKFSPDVITGLIKSNIPAKAAFTVSSLQNSKDILDFGGAEKLTGRGDMLLKTAESPRLLRLQTPFISEENISDFVEYMQGIFTNYGHFEF